MSNWLNISIGTGLVPHWLNYFRVLHYYHFLSCRAKATWDKKWKTTEKRNDQKHKKASFFHLAEFYNGSFLFYFWQNVFFTSYVPCCYFFFLDNVQTAVHSVFFKTGVLKKLAIFMGKHPCWRLFLIKFQGWRLAFLF